MKILYLSNTHQYHIAYGADRFGNICKHLARKGHEITNIYMGRAIKTIDGIDRGAVKKAQTNDPRYQVIIVPDFPYLSRNPFDFASMVYKTGYSFRHLIADYDVVHVNYVFTPPIATSALLSKYLGGAPQVVDFVDLRVWLMKIGFEVFRRIGYLPTWATVSDRYLRHFLIANGFPPELVFTILIGSDPAKIRPIETARARNLLNLKDAKFLIGYEFGSGMQKSYIDLLLSALARIVKTRDVRLLFIGDFERYHLTPYIRESARLLNVEQYIKITGTVPTNELSLWLSACDVCLMPMDNNPWDYRLPGRLGDYLAAGKPIVGSDIGEVASVISKGCGLLARPEDPIDFAKQVSRLLDDPGLAEEMGRRARSISENELSWESIANQMEQVYYRVKGQA